MGFCSAVSRRRFSLLLGAMFIYTILFGLQFMWFLQVQENLISKKDCGHSTETIGYENTKQGPLERSAVFKTNLIIGVSQSGNKKTIQQEYRETTSSPTPSLLDLEKIDWNDYDFYAKEVKRKGLGEQGKPAVLSLSGQVKKNSQKLFTEYQYNVYVSDQISVERATKDTRTEPCKTQHFIKNIPENSVSVIIVFHNERFSTLLRTVHSVVNRSPATLLREVILVDDLSVKDELKAHLDSYIKKHFDKVSVIRNNERLGLIRSRIAGADASTGSFLVFFDAHIEVNPNYLPPLLEPMVINYRTITCPMVDTIDGKTLQISGLNERIRGAFDWSLSYKRLPVKKAMDDTTPHPSPVMVGCAFGITRDWWEELEKYDLGLQIWGGEQYELSFKSWMCGGSVVDAPCSRVAHLFRSLPYVGEVVKDNRIEFNLLRVASVWMDEYKDYVVQRRSLMNGLDPGDLTKQFELKKKLNCKSFDWYINNIAPDLVQVYPPLEPPTAAWGYLRSGFRHALCLMNTDRDILLRRCVKEAKDSFSLDWRHHIYIKYKCWANPSSQHIFPWECLDVEKNKTQHFAWNRHTGQIVNFNTHLCVDCDFHTGKVLMAACDLTKKCQSWKFDQYNETLVDDLWEKYSETLSH